MGEQNEVVKVITGVASIDGVNTVTCQSLPPVRVAIVRRGEEFHGIPLVQYIPSKEWENEGEVRWVDPTRVSITVRGVSTLEQAEERSRAWADARVNAILTESTLGLEVQ